MAYYETVFIVHPDLSTENANKVVDELVERLEKAGGRIVKREYWGVRELAYRIAKRKRGHYFLLVSDADPAAQKELEQAIRLHERIIRSLTVRIEEVSDKPSPLLRKPQQEEASTSAGGA